MYENGCGGWGHGPSPEKNNNFNDKKCMAQNYIADAQLHVTALVLQPLICTSPRFRTV